MFNRSDIVVDHFAQDVLRGIFYSKPKSIPSKYLYDARGSLLFSKIMDLPEYYLTNCELEIIRENGEDLFCQCMQKEFNLIELGAGDGRKTILLLKALLRKRRKFTFIPVDISEKAIQQISKNVHDYLPEIPVRGVVGDYSNLESTMDPSDRQNIYLLLGSNIGNYTPIQALEFLLNLQTSMKKGDLLLIGIDLKKDISTLNDAYNDKRGVTDAFNYNLLERMNRELGAHFIPETFRHYGPYNPVIGAMESYLISTVRQAVPIDRLGLIANFDSGEPIHLEYSFKYTEEEIRMLCKTAHFQCVKNFKDKKEYFTDTLWMKAVGE